MPNNETAKTKWTPKTLFWWFFWLPAFMGSTVIFWFLLFGPIQQTSITLQVYQHPEAPSNHRGALKSRPWVYHLASARTPAEQEKGLGSREELRFNEGMIFLYSETADRCFWMKDMRFPIDIIWVDDAKKVTAIEHNIDPKTYPDAFCHDAKYVIELNAGEAKKAGLNQGQRLTF